MKSDPACINGLAAVAAESLCRGKSAEEIAEILRFLNVLVALVRNYVN